MKMSALNQPVLLEFCKLCDWAYKAWSMRKYLFDENTDDAQMRSPRHEHFFNRLSEILQDYWLHQVAKLHDPVIQSGQINLTIDYIVDYGGWKDEVANELTRLRNAMLDFISIDKTAGVKAARNKLLAHNDLASIIKGLPLGGFDPGQDEKYFENLRCFVNIVHENSIGGPYVFDDLVRNDIMAFTSQFNRGTID